MNKIPQNKYKNNSKKQKSISKRKKKINNRIRITLTWTLIFFIITYIALNQNTILQQLEIISELTKVFVLSTFQLITNKQFEPEINNPHTDEIEREIFEQINNIRLANNLNELHWDPYLAKLSKDHSTDMATFKYLNHTNLIGLNPTQRAKIIGIRTRIKTENNIYEGVLENIGLMPKGIVQDIGVIITDKDVASAMVFSWMKSEPHKKNILEQDIFFTGVGVAFDGNGKYYLTQNFQ